MYLAYCDESGTDGLSKFCIYGGIVVHEDSFKSLNTLLQKECDGIFSQYEKAKNKELKDICLNDSERQNIEYRLTNILGAHGAKLIFGIVKRIKDEKNQNQNLKRATICFIQSFDRLLADYDQKGMIFSDYLQGSKKTL